MEQRNLVLTLLKKLNNYHFSNMENVLSELSFKLVEKDDKVSIECSFINDLEQLESMSDLIFFNMSDPKVSKAVILLHTLSQHLKEYERA